jgi:hypothetical protein
MLYVMVVATTIPNCAIDSIFYKNIRETEWIAMSGIDKHFFIKGGEVVEG